MAMGSQSMTMPVKTTLADDGLTLVGTPQGKLSKGSHTLCWTAASADGHETTGSLSFQVK
jgi:methionine-rich copper-binding protein CopC